MKLIKKLKKIDIDKDVLTFLGTFIVSFIICGFLGGIPTPDKIWSTLWAIVGGILITAFFYSPVTGSDY